MSDLDDGLMKVAELIIGNIDDAGFLQTSDELVFSSGQQASHIQTVLDVIQAFHPPGVGARDLRECLMLQLSGPSVWSRSSTRSCGVWTSWAAGASRVLRN